MLERIGGVFLAVCLVVLLGACTAARPSDGQIRDLVAAEAGATGDDPLFELRDFERTDGRDAGEGRYIAEVTYTLVYRKSSEELKAALAEEIEKDGKPEGLEGMGRVLGAGLGMFALAFQSFEKGDTKEMSSTVTLERWESGWKLVSSE